VIAVAIEPKTKADQDKMGLALAKLSEEDPTFVVNVDNQTGQTLIHGMGELHMEVLVDRLFREFKVDARVGKPRVSYRETITRPAEGVGRFVRQTGGSGQYGHAVITLEPLREDADAEVVFENKIVGGTIPKEYIRPVRRRAARSGAERRLRRVSAGARQGHAGRMARTTKWTRPRWHSRSPARWR